MGKLGRAWVGAWVSAWCMGSVHGAVHGYLRPDRPTGTLRVDFRKKSLFE